MGLSFDTGALSLPLALWAVSAGIVERLWCDCEWLWRLSVSDPASRQRAPPLPEWQSKKGGCPSRPTASVLPFLSVFRSGLGELLDFSVLAVLDIGFYEYPLYDKTRLSLVVGLATVARRRGYVPLLDPFLL